MILAHKIQLQPNNEHRAFFARACGTARFCFNWALAEWKRQYEAGEKPNALALKKQFNQIQTEQFPWVGEVNSHTKQQAFADVGIAFKNFFRRVKNGEKPGYPKFKKKGKCRDSFYLANIEFKVDGHHIRLPKIGYVRLCEPLRFQGKIMAARISRDADRWYISIQVDVGEITPKHNSETQARAIGVDFGVKALATLSSGEAVEGPKALAKNRRKLKRLQRQLRKDKRKPGSNRYKRYAGKVARLHRRIRWIREDSLHQLSARLAHDYSVICIEDLNVKGMSASAAGTTEDPGRMVKQKSGLNRNILDMGFFELRRQLEYKSAITGGQVIAIDRWAPSSKTCSNCGAYKSDLELSDRIFRCDACGTERCRDHNASISILTMGLSTLDGTTAGAAGSQARGADGSVTDHRDNQQRRNANAVGELRL